MSFDVVVIGSVNVDIVARGEHLPRANETCAAEELVEGYGGKGANQAIAAKRFGASVAMVAAIGDDARGAGARRNLEESGVDVANVRAVTGVPTGVAVIHVGANGDKAIMAVKGANFTLGASEIALAKEIIEPRTIVVAQLEIGGDAVLAAAELARSRGARFVLDPAPARALPDRLYALCTLIKPNAREAETLTGVAVKDRTSAIRAAKELLLRGVQAVTIASPEGNHLVTNEEEKTFKKHDVRSIDATGAGDAFVGALVASLAKGASLEDSALFANAAAALKTTRLGAQALPSAHEIKQLLGH